MMKHVSKAGKVDPGDRVTLPVKFASKPELSLTHLLSRSVNLSPCKQALSTKSGFIRVQKVVFTKTGFYLAC